ncbi:MAG: KUP/HAK/KT family potassium transporter [Acidimicrobiales bacterium]
MQQRGTAKIATIFSPIMVVWFAVLGGLGLRQIIAQPAVRAVSATYAIAFFGNEPPASFVALGSIFLVVTGGEALTPIWAILVGRQSRHRGMCSYSRAAAQLLRSGGLAGRWQDGSRQPVL